MLKHLQRSLLQTLVICLMAGVPFVPAQAGIIGTDQAIALGERADTVAQVRSVLMRADVQSQLEALGVDPAAAMERVGALTAAELAQLQAGLDQLPAGGSALGVLGAVLLVLLVLELLGVTNVFTGI